MGERRANGTRSRVILILINLVSIACLVWTLRDAKLGELKDDLLTMNWSWVLAAVAADVVVYCVQAVRWSLLLRPVAAASFRQTLGAIYVGLFANEVLPLRAGEVLRCYLLSASVEELPFSVSVSSALIERVFDGVWLYLCLMLMLRWVPIPHHLRFLIDGGYVLGFVVLVLAVLLALAMFWREKSNTMLAGNSWRRHVRVLIEDLHRIGHSRYLYFAGFVSLLYLLMQVIPIYASFKGYGFDLSLGTAFAVMVILRLGAVVPQAPGNLGLFQFLTKEALERIFHVVPAEAARFSLVLWGIVTLPLLIGGIIALSITGAKIGELRRAAARHADILVRPPAD